jgi:hypothetical protein
MTKNLMALAMAALALLSNQASAAVVQIGDRATFDAMGSIALNSNFDDYAGSGFAGPGDPFTRGGITYTSGDNLIVDQCYYSIGCVRPVMSYNSWSPITGTVDTSTPYNLFGFDAAVTSGLVSFAISTNLATYYFNDQLIGNGAPNFSFAGFSATDGEYFTGFRFSSGGGGYLPGMTNVSLGQASNNNVPEPVSSALFALGLAGIAAARRNRKMAR